LSITGFLSSLFAMDCDFRIEFWLESLQLADSNDHHKMSFCYGEFLH